MAPAECGHEICLMQQDTRPGTWRSKSPELQRGGPGPLGEPNRTVCQEDTPKCTMKALKVFLGRVCCVEEAKERDQKAS